MEELWALLHLDVFYQRMKFHQSPSGSDRFIFVWNIKQRAIIKKIKQGGVLDLNNILYPFLILYYHCEKFQQFPLWSFLVTGNIKDFARRRRRERSTLSLDCIFDVTTHGALWVKFVWGIILFKTSLGLCSWINTIIRDAETRTYTDSTCCNIYMYYVLTVIQNYIVIHNI